MKLQPPDIDSYSTHFNVPAKKHDHLNLLGGLSKFEVSFSTAPRL